jgi:hypothetical protein
VHAEAALGHRTPTRSLLLRRRWQAPLLDLDLLEPRAEVEELEDVAAARAR